jgi:drug/metabolite transporter (DMT)-like permease
MTPLRILGIVLILVGAVALAYGGFSYTKDTHQAKIGPIELSLKEKEQVDIPKWLGLGAILAGVALVVVGRK